MVLQLEFWPGARKDARLFSHTHQLNQLPCCIASFPQPILVVYSSVMIILSSVTYICLCGSESVG
ncbi:hypothetical protein BD310DRAFT_541671 [Dichomitus squalens]|uniref:Uncharacterized protein n=1 Tax=Dichomitus squalens TaxID=114155 RepID=A0A4Q9PT25_9APHY|nr:hypothetical protein BD310DRAFT_541671 [Dichomitus squalens]